LRSGRSGARTKESLTWADVKISDLVQQRIFNEVLRDAKNDTFDNDETKAVQDFFYAEDIPVGANNVNVKAARGNLAVSNNKNKRKWEIKNQDLDKIVNALLKSEDFMKNLGE